MRIKDLDSLQVGDLLHYAYMPDNRLYSPVSRVYRVASVCGSGSTGAHLNVYELTRLPSGDYLNTGGGLWLSEFDGTLSNMLPNLSKLDDSISRRIKVGA